MLIVLAALSLLLALFLCETTVRGVRVPYAEYAEDMRKKEQTYLLEAEYDKLRFETVPGLARICAWHAIAMALMHYSLVTSHGTF